MSADIPLHALAQAIWSEAPAAEAPAITLHPAFAEAEVVEIGTDARPAFPDNLPRLTRRGRVIHVNGLYRHGFLLSPAMARMATEAVLNPQATPEMLHDFAA